MKNAVEVENLGVSFDRHKSTLQSEISKLGRANWMRLLKRDAEKLLEENRKWVFRNVNFEVGRGESLGILGGNGSGKTTLLKVLSHVLYPTEGLARVEGRVASLLAVGTGFNHSYTGRENVFLNGMILGLSRREIVRRFDEIVEFADIGDAIDIPVKNYSTGMRARLAFSVATRLESDIVMLDEVLAVGDAGFRERCLDVVRNMKRQQRTILLVSHSMDAIDSFCDRAMTLQNGGIGEIGQPVDVIRSYLDTFKTVKEKEVALRDRLDRDGSGAIRIVDYRLETTSGLEVHQPQAGMDLVVSLKYETETKQVLEDVEVGLVFFSSQGHKLVRFATRNIKCNFQQVSGAGYFQLRIPRFPFATGTYLIGYRILVEESVADYIPNAFEIDVMAGDYFGTGVNDEHSPLFVNHDWDIISEE
ncbi:MAG: polysaccharide ABC transporter ATP-binding protein [Pseudomonadota bacterium]